DLAAMADDSGVAEQPLDVTLAEAGDDLRIEAGESGAEVLPLAEDRQPREPGLEPFEAEPFVEPALVAHGPSPLFVVVSVVRRVLVLPAANDAVHATSTLT